MTSEVIHSRWLLFRRDGGRTNMSPNHSKMTGPVSLMLILAQGWNKNTWFIIRLLWHLIFIDCNIWFHGVNVIFPSGRWQRKEGQTYTVSRSTVYPQISRLRLVLSPGGGASCTRRCHPAGAEPVDWTWTLAGSRREVRSSWFSSTLQPPLMREQWRWTKAVYTVQTQPWAAAHWLILRCVWERRGTPFSSFVLVSVNSVVGGRAHCGGQCFVLTQGLAQLVPRVQPEDSWIMERESSGPKEFTNLTCLIIKQN